MLPLRTLVANWLVRLLVLCHIQIPYMGGGKVHGGIKSTWGGTKSMGGQSPGGGGTKSRGRGDKVQGGGQSSGGGGTQSGDIWPRLPYRTTTRCLARRDFAQQHSWCINLFLPNLGNINGSSNKPLNDATCGLVPILPAAGRRRW